MKNMVIVFAFSLIPFCSLASDGSVALTGTKAADLLNLMEKTKASVAGEKDACGAGSCHQQGSLDVVCQAPMNAQEEGMTSDCTVSATGKNGMQVSLTDAKAKKMINLLESSHALVSNPDTDCDHGLCHSKGTISVTCSYPMNKKEKDQYACEVSPVVTKSSRSKTNKAATKSDSGGQ